MDAKTSTEPAHVRAGPTHPDPYRYYARLAIERPLHREDASGAWVAASAAAVTAVLESPLCFTRPAAGPVSEAMAGTPVADLFRRLVRMIDSERHCPLKSAIATTLDGVDMARLAETARVETSDLGWALRPERDGESLTRFIYALPVHVIAGALGIPRDRFADVARWMGDYSAAAAAAVTSVPPVSPGVMEAGGEGARQLMDLFRVLLGGLEDDDPSLFAQLARQASRDGRTDAESVVANGVGLMAQGFAATSALTGATLLALAHHPEVLAAVRQDRRRLSDVVQEVLRCDPVTQSTPRFVARDGVVAGQAMREGEMIIVVLAAANRDPALNPDPDRFDPFRENRKYLEFGAGAHACPGATMSTLIAEIAVNGLIDRGVAFDGLEAAVAYRPSAHIRLPIFR